MQKSSRREQLAYMVGLSEHHNDEQVIEFAIDIGIEPKVHEGNSDLSENMIAEWLMGQIVNIYSDEDNDQLVHAVAINSAINIARSFLNYDYGYGSTGVSI